MLVSGDRIIKGVEQVLRDRSKPGQGAKGALAGAGGGSVLEGGDP
jgi:hypothetical protein